MSEILSVYSLTESTRLEIAQGDLTRERVDAIVNAANDHLAHGAGVAAAILRAGGPAIARESEEWVRKHGPVTHAEPADTTAGDMPARRVIHAVGPVWGEGLEDEKLAEAVLGSLLRAEQLLMESVAFPAISTGIYGFPKDRAARVMYEAFKAHFADYPGSTIKLVRLTLWDDDTVQIFLHEGARAFSRQEPG